MPDRDDFNVLQPPYRRAARALVRAAQGNEPDLLEVADMLNLQFRGGIATLGRVLRLVDAQAASFPDDSFKRLYVRELEELLARSRRTGNDQRLHQEAVRAREHGISDPHEFLRRFILNVINAELIEARGGVMEHCRRRGLPLDMAHLERALSPLVDTAAAHMLRRPDFKRLGLASETWREVDLYNENLLGALV